MLSLKSLRRHLQQNVFPLPFIRTFLGIDSVIPSGRNNHSTPDKLFLRLQSTSATPPYDTRRPHDLEPDDAAKCDLEYQQSADSVLQVSFY